MTFFKKAGKQNYDLWSGHSWYVPGIRGMFTLLVLLFAGALVGSFVGGIFIFAAGKDVGVEYIELIQYPIMFFPPVIWVGYTSRRNMMFENGYNLDNNNFAPKNGWWLALICMVGTFAMSFCVDAVNSLLPPMPEWLEEALTSMTGGKIWVDFLCVSIMAPLFEEWLCRGMVLRGLLNYKRADGTTLKPVWAIVVSALFFAVIHLNPWQGIPAFMLGLMFGYVYYKTGSLKLTMLMHFTNNTLALIFSHIDSLKDMDSWKDVLSPAAYVILFLACAAFLYYMYTEFKAITLRREEGNCDELPAGELPQA